VIRIRGIATVGDSVQLEVEYDCLGENRVSALTYQLRDLRGLSRAELRERVVEYVKQQRVARLRELVLERMGDLVDVDFEAEEEFTVA